eukprot:CAMPEP_0177635906 /NCGR_PEP_ID=MMETSP0447-20121125/4154_1 /TAXON_ID=0 /ORGANISM="Stygamoeba regulata, Strain BSH-02190019" /LENGTH=210 /DNA_ID=CAMNT_0019137731 /DNA_START=290 /DNA_END=922 /DNA_ORIENTATION=-
MATLLFSSFTRSQARITTPLVRCYAMSSSQRQAFEARRKLEVTLLSKLTTERLRFRSFHECLSAFQSQVLRKDALGYEWMVAKPNPDWELRPWFEVEDGMTVLPVYSDELDPEILGGSADETLEEAPFTRAVFIDWKTNKLTFYIDGSSSDLTRTILLPSDWLLRFKLFQWPSNTLPDTEFEQEFISRSYDRLNEQLEAEEMAALNAVIY